MESKIVVDAPPFLRILGDGTVHRMLGFEKVPSSLDGPVASKDVASDGVSVRLYLPTHALHSDGVKLPVVVYFHGGGFCVASATCPEYHNYLNLVAEEANVACVSVDYRLAPEHRLPAAYDDCFAALQWLARQAQAQQNPHGVGFEPEPWLFSHADFSKCFLAGDSAGANIVHEMGIRASESGKDFAFAGCILAHPFFCAEEDMGSEVSPHAEPLRKTRNAMLKIFLPPGEDRDYPPLNPWGPRSPPLAKLRVYPRVLVIVSGKDMLKDRGILYQEALVKEGIVADLMKIEDEEHVFHLLDLRCQNATLMMKRISEFIHMN
uniref:Alpha/beta hydrolase fold-3 domain-containing protein n=1 Tax=Araucaria cunninghamii TaxID=56994 RepID=A0A0D6R4C0_ARACU